MEALVEMAYVDDYTNTSNEILYNYTRIEVLTSDIATSQVFNYVYGIDAFNYNYSAVSSVDPKFKPPSYANVGLACGLFGSEFNGTFGCSRSQIASVDWIKVRKIASPAPMVVMGPMESLYYGWTDVSDIGCGDTKEPGSLLRDFNNATFTRTFKVLNLPAGNYSITITMGDKNRTRDHMHVSASVEYIGGGGENLGYVISDLTLDAGEFVSEWFAVSMEKSGNISITFSDADGGTAGDTGWVVNAITIERGIKGVRIETE
ncbi:MAG TPA: hypothetical protein ENG74_03950 [Thermoplasmatales archaeon]|nr:hypothetical protein [Thermoplasmatales archaeon]